MLYRLETPNGVGIYEDYLNRLDSKDRAEAITAMRDAWALPNPSELHGLDMSGTKSFFTKAGLRMFNRHHARILRKYRDIADIRLLQVPEDSIHSRIKYYDKYQVLAHK